MAAIVALQRSKLTQICFDNVGRLRYLNFVNSQAHRHHHHHAHRASAGVFVLS